MSGGSGLRESLQEVVEAARESEKRLQDDIRDRAVKCGEDLKTAQRDLSANLVRDYTALDSKLKGQDDALMRVDRRHEEGIAGCVPHTLRLLPVTQRGQPLTVSTCVGSVGKRIEDELHKFEGTVALRIEKQVAVAEANLETNVGALRGRVETLELLHHDTTESNRRVDDRCSTLESAMLSRVSEAEAKAVKSDELILEGFGRFSEQTGSLVGGLERKLDGATEALRGQLEASVSRLRENLTEEVARLDSADSVAKVELQDVQSDLNSTIMRETTDVKELQKAATARQDAKISKVETEVLEQLTHGITTLRVDTEATMSDQDKKIATELANVKSDADESSERITKQLTTLEEELTGSVSKQLAEVRSEVAAKAAAMDTRLKRGLEECEEAIERKAEVGFVKTLEMLLRQDLEETNTAVQQVHEELGEQAEQIEKVEGRMEREEGEVSELSTDLGLMEAGIMANLMSVEMEQAELRESVTTQIAEEVGACKAASEDGAEVLRLEVQASLSGFKSEIDETVVRQMGSRISSSEAAVNGRVAAMEERVSEAASKTELKTQTGLIRIDLEEISTAIQAVDEMVNDDKAAEALDQRLEQLDGEPPLDANTWLFFHCVRCTASLIAF